MKQVPVVAETITPPTCGLRILPLDRQVQIIGNVLDDLITRAVGSMYQPYRRIGSVKASSNDATCASVRMALYVLIEVGHASSGTGSVASANADQGMRPVLRGRSRFPEPQKPCGREL
jgi:hypothetical protein